MSRDRFPYNRVGDPCPQCSGCGDWFGTRCEPCQGDGVIDPATRDFFAVVSTDPDISARLKIDFDRAFAEPAPPQPTVSEHIISLAARRRRPA